MVKGIREIEKMMQCPVDKNDTEEYENVRTVFQKSIVAVKNTPAGTVLTAGHLAFKKPGDGISASEYKKYLGRRLRVALKKNEKLTQGSVE